MKSTAAWIGQVISWLVIFAVLAVLAVCVLIPRLGGGTPYTILTGSMSSSYPPGTLVVTKPVAINQVNIGDVITFQVETGKPTVVTHRVIGTTVAKDGTPRLITKGDSNASPDADLVQAAQIKGTMWYAVPVLGRANVLLDKSQHQVVAIAVGSGLLLYAAFMLVSAASDTRSAKTSRRRAARQKGEVSA
ncbi:signal peptidase I [Aeromicrobium sp.]|uniref:signal peptidase I n=1 Tax=Aeromicrobium sp. TaxID=1871063 RepID=UPI0019A24D4F|nr:signal peptidase I [Aeromicrobium sp.]MBC7630671.1 signal peptidase I [Aeromicrobium sp.]